MPTDSPQPTAALSEAHRRELEVGSAIDSAVIAERGYRSLEHGDREELSAFGISVNSKASFPGLLLPMFRATGEPISAQFKPARPMNIKGKPVKYLSPRGGGNHLDVHPRNRPRINDVTVPLWITEGVKKGDSLTSRGCCAVTLTGVYNWRSKFGTLGDWEDVPLKGRDVVICFDADATKNMNVARAMVRLGRWCQSKGAQTVRYLIVSSEVSGKATKGVDDYFAAGGALEALEACATPTEPDTETADDTFSDSRLAETLADEVFVDRFVWCKSLGWMGWNGLRWSAATEETVGEAVRQHVLERFVQATEESDKDGSKGWYSMLNANRQVAVLKLARGIVERSADDFDSDADLLNTPEGIVHLPTGAIWRHDPDLLMTKITRGSYRPGYGHRDWEQALTALREDARPWFQARVGQAITGQPTLDGVIPVCQGTGENGKSALLTDGLLPALGDYAAPASPKLIATKNEHSTERADLRGQRLVIAEELTEDRALNITAPRRAQAGMRPPPIVVGHPFAQDAAEMTLVERNQPVQTLPPYRPISRSQNALALWRSPGRFQHAQSHRSDRAVDRRGVDRVAPRGTVAGAGDTGPPLVTARAAPAPGPIDRRPCVAANAPQDRDACVTSKLLEPVMDFRLYWAGEFGTRRDGQARPSSSCDRVSQ